MTPTQEVEVAARKSSLHPFRGAVIRGLGVLLPPLLTVVIFLWIGGTLQQYMLEPIMAGAERLLVWTIADIRSEEGFPAEQLVKDKENPLLGGVVYQRLESGGYVPKFVYDVVRRRSTEEVTPRSGQGIYRVYVRLTYLRPAQVIPLFLALFLLTLYLLGKFMAAGIGRFFWGLFEGGIQRVPLVRAVYSAVKQVSGFLLNERDMRVSRVVAVEYPRKGIWQLGFVTGEGMPAIEAVVGEECLSVLVCTSPMPMAGFTVNVRRSEVVDLNITLDQAIQFIVSCGVVVPRPKDAKSLTAAAGGPQLLGPSDASYPYPAREPTQR